MKQAAFAIIISLLSAVLAIAGYKHFEDREKAKYQSELPTYAGIRFASNHIRPGSAPVNPDFVQAASLVAPAVVHIKTLYEGEDRRSANSLYGFFGLPQAQTPVRGSGSGVIISPDGYIVTNNHVIEHAAAIEVVLPDKRVYKATLVGRDPNTDLALLKVDGADLPVVPLGNSDNVQVGEWVLAVGYPLSLNSTVTAGIISAKGRSIGILNHQGQGSYEDASQLAPNTPIESFIQTDAAINPGNSGGALVNANGQLIGINAAIASQTGSYAGYGFAIPVNLMRKVVSDFRKYGEVRRGYLGVSFPAPAIEDQLWRERGIDPALVIGVFITGVQPGGAAAVAGLREGDIIQSIDGVRVASSAELSERIARHHPGDQVEISYFRGGRTSRVYVRLKGEEEYKDVTERNLAGMLGAAFAPLPESTKRQYGLRSGVYITQLQRGGFFDSAGIPEGTVITHFNGVPVNSISDISNALRASKAGAVRVHGFTPDGTGFVFSFPLGT
ncbi:trypsin-like peptidase domain-containing protein [Pontibacter ummariensis]|uniref:Do/DeqQ family serine protease n=1 Tax=Pontibacter ummariensis TaxID=1610492 RepID=A0A239LR98_9BACT|nr:trypsin-like peptidase domain-containing protein [Pontibacter ummariensis]SNT32905.1 Do/DeqQ family serine protease [Pontibacter ummariensis]